MRRARRAHTVVDPEWLEPLERYFSLLARWNEKINLTALPLKDPTDHTFDRLMIEPLAASRYVPNKSDSWYDLGSGGGSPAIPMKISRPLLSLTMVEAKSRKAAFLREAVRLLELESASVVNKRIDALGAGDVAYGSCGFVTVRAVRADPQFFDVAAQLLRYGGQLLLFQPTENPISREGFRHLESTVLIEAPRTYLSVLIREISRTKSSV